MMRPRALGPALATCLILATSAASVRAAPSDADAKAQEVVSLLEAWQLTAARPLAEELLAQAPNDPVSWYAAGRVQHERGYHLSALRLLEAAATAGVGRGGEILERVRGSAAYAADFQTLETAHFRIGYLDKDAVLASYAGPVLEAAYRRIGGALGLLPAEGVDKIAIEIYPDARGLADATGLTVKEIETSGTIAVCKFHRLMVTSPLATTSGYDWADTIAHEFTHLVISQKSHNNTPIWLHEGIAKFYESLWKGEAGADLSPYSEHLLANAVKKDELITFAQMHPSMAKLPSQEAAALAFAEVFTVIEYLRGRYGAESIPKLLELLGDGVTLEKALPHVFGKGLAGLERDWKRYLKRRKFHDVPGAAPHRIHLAEGETSDKEPPLESIEDKDVHKHARLGELLELRQHHEAAIVEYERAYARAGVRYPSILYRLINAYLDAKRASEARKVVTAALAAHPDDGDLELVAGRVALATDDAAAARRYFEAARLRNPYNPELHAALAMLYDAAGDKKAADQEVRLLKLCKKPRPRRPAPDLEPPAAAASVSLTSLPWGFVRIDGGIPRALPLWNWPLAPGEHALELVGTGKSSKRTSVTLDSGDHAVQVLR